jgi:hypothetical protein
MSIRQVRQGMPAQGIRALCKLLVKKRSILNLNILPIVILLHLRLSGTVKKQFRISVNMDHHTSLLTSYQPLVCKELSVAVLLSVSS